jgi:hypothetical protein
LDRHDHHGVRRRSLDREGRTDLQTMTSQSDYGRGLAFPA